MILEERYNDDVPVKELMRIINEHPEHDAQNFRWVGSDHPEALDPKLNIV